MKIADPEIIKTSEQNLMDTLMEEINWTKLAPLLKNQFNLEKLKCHKGDLIVHENKIAYRMDVELNLNLSVLFDQEGNLITPLPDTEAAEAVPEMDEEIDLADFPLEDDLVEDDLADEDKTGELAKDEDSEETDGLNLDLKKSQEFWDDRIKDAGTDMAP